MRYILFFAAILFSYSGILADEGDNDQHDPSFFIRGDLGLNYASGKQLFTFGQRSDRVTGEYGSMGEGIDINFSAGYQYHEHFAFILGSGYLSSAMKTGVSAFNFGLVPAGNVVGEYSGNSYFIKPAIKVSFELDNDIEPYMSLGVLAAFPQMYWDFEEVDSGPVGSTEMHEGRLEFGRTFELGLFNEAGIQINFGDNYSVFSGLSFTSLGYLPDYVELTELEVNGEDELGDLSDQEKRLEFKEELTEQDLQQQNNVTIGPAFNFSAISIRAGLNWHF